MASASQVSELLQFVEDARDSRQAECKRLLLELTPRLKAHRADERQRDRQRAPRFNVFKYLRQDELGLSRMIADLLDPTAEHGQGTSFLEAMLAAFPETRERSDTLRTTVANSIRVVTERWTTAGGRIDITVEIPSATGRFCLAFENKPFADDQPGQLVSYLEYLDEEYGKRFLLVYLPPVLRQPHEAALPKAELEHWQGRFRVMPYTRGDPSLEEWFATCRKLCNAERLYWFLRQAQLFCRQRFGESTMSNDAETLFVSEYLFKNPSHLRAALAVHDAWPVVRAELCERFLPHLRQVVEDRLPKQLSDIKVQCRYRREKKYSSSLWITRDAWVRYDDLPSNRDGRTAIKLQSVRRGPTRWYWGVCSPKPLSKMSETEKERREKLGDKLGNHGLALAHDSDWWPQWEWLSPRYADWNSLAPNLYEECEEGNGPITTYYVEGLLNIAAHAIPAIDEVELAN